MEKITKADLRQPDMFVEGASAFWLFVEKHFKTVLAVFILLVLASVVYIAKSFFEERSEKHAINDLYPLESQVLKTKDAFEKSKSPMSDSEDKTPAKKPTGDIQADYGTSLSALEAFATGHQDYVAGAEAGLIAASVYSDYQKPEKAVEILTPLAQKFSSRSPLIYGLLQMALGTATASKGDCKSAIDSWQKIINNDKLKFLAADAQIKAGVCFETLGDLAQAKNAYEKASAGQGNVSKSAKTLLRALEVKKAQGV